MLAISCRAFHYLLQFVIQGVYSAKVMVLMWMRCTIILSFKSIFSPDIVANLNLTTVMSAPSSRACTKSEELSNQQS